MKPLLFVLFSLGFSLVAPALDTPGQVARPLPISGKLYSDYRKLLLSPPQGASEKQIAEWFGQAFLLLQKMNEPREYDALLKLAAEKYADNIPVMLMLYDCAGMMPSYGYRIGGDFVRGNNRGGYGLPLSASERDRVLLLRMYDKLYRKAPDAVPAEFLAHFAGLWLTGRSGGSSWKLQQKTDPGVLPDYSEERGQSSNPPVNDDGDPVFYRTPETLESAVNDGERFQFFRRKARERNCPFADRIYADFLREQFGNPPVNHWNITKEERDLLANLPDSETITRLADGIRRFRMPDGHNFITLYRELKEWDTLASVYMSRFQLDRALEEYRKTNNTYMIQQITGNLGALQPLRVLPAGREPELAFLYRNAKEGNVTIRRIRENALFDALFTNLSKAGDSGYMPFYELDIPTLQKLYADTIGSEIAAFPLKLNPLPRHANTMQNIKLPLKDAGAYLVTIALKDGNTSQIIVWLTDCMISISNGQSTPLMYLNRAADGAPVPGQTVHFRFFRTIYAQNPDELKKSGRVRIETKDFKAVTAADGSVPLPPIPANMHRFWAFARISGKPVFYSGYSYNLSSTGSQNFSGSMKAFMLTSRPVYKPGDKVEFSGFLRRASYDGSNAKHPDFVDITVSAPRGKTLYTAKMPVSRKTGAFAGVFTLPEDTALGSYRISCSKYGSVGFRTEEYRKPEYEAKLELPAAPVKLGETVTATLRANYYFGAPVPDAAVSCRIYREITQPYFPVKFPYFWLYGDGYELPSTCYIWRFHPWYTNRELIAEFSGRTGSDGTFPVRINTAVPGTLEQKNYRFHIEAEVTDSSRKVVSASGFLIAAAKPVNLFLYPVNGFRRLSDPVHLCVTATDPNGREIKGAGIIRLYRARLSPDLQYENDGEAIRTIRFRSEEGNPSFVLNKAGVYRAEAEFNSAEGKATAACIIRILDSNGAAGMFSSLPIELSLDKPTYQPGETAQILISANRPDADVYVLLNGKWNHLKLNGYSALVTCKITEKDRPNIFTAAFTIRNGETHHVTKQLCIPPENRMLNVKLEVPEYDAQPRTTVPVDLTVTDADGKPVSGAFALTVYDKSLEAIAGNNIPDIQSFFWGWKRWFYLTLQSGTNAVSHPYYPGQTMDIISGIPFFTPQYRKRFSVCKSEAVVAAEAAPAMAVQEDNAAGGGEEQAFVRSDFADSIFWIGQRLLGADGRARILVPVPDNLTTWVVRAWSIGSRTSVGEARAEFVVSKEIIARLQLPPFLMAGDTAEALAIVHNYSKQTIRAELNLSLTGDAVSVQSHGKRFHTIAPGKSATIPFLLRANREGSANPVLSVSVNGRLADAVALSLPVNVRGIRKYVPAAGRIRNQIAKVEYFIPQIRRNSAELTVSITPGAAVAMTDLLPYLAAEDSSSVFGTVTRFLPALKASRVFSELNLPFDAVLRRSSARAKLYADYLKPDQRLPDSKKALDKLIADNLKMVQGMVNSDGGWGWFSGYGESSWTDTTAFVVDALLEARKQKLAVNPDILKRGIDWLFRKARERYEKSSLPANNVDALHIRTLAKAGKRFAPLEQLVFRHRDSLSPLGLAMLGQTLKNGSPEQKTVLIELENLLKRDSQAGTAYLNIPTRWRFEWSGSETAAQAAYLELLLQTGSESGLTEAVARYLTINLRNAPSRTSTRALGEAVGALASYIRKSGEAVPETNVMIKLDEGHIKSFRITKENVWNSDFSVRVPTEMLYSGKHVLEISCAGRGAVYYQTMLSYFSQEQRIGAAGQELKLNRRYYRIATSGVSSKAPDKLGQLRDMRTDRETRIPLTDPANVKAGDIVEVELIPETKNDYDYVEFRDRLPAGFEYVKPQSGYISWYPVIYAEFATEGPRFYLRNLTRGTASIRYRIRARFDGSYTALPATGAGVYAPALRANSSDALLTIQEK
jgi:hypothetical protein